MAFVMFFGVQVEIKNWDGEFKSCNLILKENPLEDFVVLPQCYKQTLWYSNVVCGIVRGALEMINIKVNCQFTKDVLRGD